MMPQQHRDKVGYNYKRIAQIGQGNYGSVFLYKRKNSNSNNTFTDFFLNHKNPDSQYFALKRYKQVVKDRGVDFSALRQINLLSIMVHPNIVTAHQIFVDSIGSRKDITVVMDFHLQLSDILKNQKIFSSQSKKRLICYHMVKGLAYMHQHHIFHRDLKPHNIFVSRKGEVKIGDFGFSKQFGTPHKKYTPQVCTKQYRAPQLFFGTNYYTEKTDVWSLGCLFYYVYKKQTLFDSYNPSDLDILARIFALTGTPNQLNWPNFQKFPKFIKFTHTEGHNLHKQRNMDKDISELIHLCISLDPSKRPTAKQLLKHNFFTSFLLQEESLQVNNIFEEKLQIFKK